MKTSLTATVDLYPGSPSLISEAAAINALGDVAGYREGAAFGPFRAALWKAPGDRFDLETTPGVDSYAVALNDLGQCAGTVGTGFPTAAYWDASLALHQLPNTTVLLGAMFHQQWLTELLTFSVGPPYFTRQLVLSNAGRGQIGL